MKTRRLRSVPRALAVLLLGAFVSPGCPDPVPLPLTGWAEFQDLLFVRVPGGSVNAGGGNFHTRRTDLSLDTRVGSYAIGAVYNSASGGWRWAHEMTWAGTTFVDESGATFDLTGIAYGAAIPGTHWVVLGADSVKTKGGLVHDFSATGKLAAIHWLGFDYPRLRFTTATVGGGTERVTAIDQCTAAASCANLFTLGYTASAELQAVTDSASRTASFTWSSGRLATAKDGLDNAKGWLGFRYEYSGANLTAITNSESERIEYTYDGSARLKTAKKIGDGNPTYSFDYFGAQPDYLYRTRFTNPLAEVTNIRYDSQRRLASLELAAVSETTSFLWTGRRVSRITRPDGVQTNFQITNDDVSQVSEASGNVTTITYAPNSIDPSNPRGRPVDVISDSIGPVLDRGYDAQGRLTSVENGADDTTTYAWNTGSPTELASVTSPQGVLTTFSGHGAHGHPGNATTGALDEDYSYDAPGNLLSGPDADTELSPGMPGVESRVFDADRNVESVSLKRDVPTGGTETLTLETRSDGLLRAIRRPFGGDTEFDYSATGRVLARREKADGAWVATSFDYDDLDRVTSTELANGMRSDLGYDGAGRVRTITSKRSGVTEETLTRTFANGRLVSSLDSAYTGPETYSYDSAGRVSTITYPGGERREIGYDLRSRVTSERFVDAAEVTVLELSYAYDPANRITEIRRQPFSLLQLKYTYTNGFLTQTDYGNGLRRTATPDLDYGLPATTVTTNPQSQTIESTQNDFFGLLHRRLSTIASRLNFESFSVASEWRLGQTNHVFGEQDVDPDHQSGGEQFRWDSLSNFRQSSVQELLFNPEANRLLQIRDIEVPNTVRHSYAYDVAGFVTDRDGVAFGYDATGAIASIGTVAAFDHDLDGRPVSRTLNGVTKSFRFGGAIAYSTAGNPIEADLGEVVIKLDGSGNLYRHVDFRGNVLFQTNAAGNVTGQAVYRGFGRFTVNGNLGQRGFAGGFEIPSLGLTVLGPRVLDTDAGRFLSQDPVFNAVNQYAYAQGNPVFLWDPTGTTSVVYDVAGFVGSVSGWAVAWATTGGNPVATVAVGLPLSTALRADAVINAYHVWHGLHFLGLADEPPTPTAFDLLGFGPGAGSTESHGPDGGLGGGIQSGGGDPPSMPPGPPGWDFEGIEGFSGAYFQIQIAVLLSISVP